MTKRNFSASWKRGFDAAQAASRLSNGPTSGTRMGAALYAGSNLLSVGFNDWTKTSPHSYYDNYCGSTHAEVSALLKRRHYDKSRNMILYVSRTITNPAQTEVWNGCSRPCAKCLEFSRINEIKRIRFFDENGSAIEIKP